MITQLIDGSQLEPAGLSVSQFDNERASLASGGAVLRGCVPTRDESVGSRRERLIPEAGQLFADGFAKWGTENMKRRSGLWRPAMSPDYDEEG